MHLYAFMYNSTCICKFTCIFRGHYFINNSCINGNLVLNGGYPHIVIVLVRTLDESRYKFTPVFMGHHVCEVNKARGFRNSPLLMREDLTPQILNINSLFHPEDKLLVM